MNEERINIALLQMLQEAVATKREYWHDDANKLLKKICGDNWQDELWKRRFANEDLQKELGDV